jgi:hypothetical protein
MTAGDLAVAISQEVARGDRDFALRLLARSVADFRALRQPDEIEAFLAAPPTTGDQRWDTLLAGTFSRECRLRGNPIPAWTRVPPLDVWWFPDNDPMLTARTMQRTPVDLHVLGIWLDGAALESL